MPKNWNMVLLWLIVSVAIWLLVAWLLYRPLPALGQTPLPTMASTSWVAPAATFTPVLQPWTPSPAPTVTPTVTPTQVSVYLPLINALASSGVCSIVPGSRGRTFAKLHEHPGGDGALYVYIDGELITWFSAQGRWFYVTSKADVAVYGYDSAGNLLCGG